MDGSGPVPASHRILGLFTLLSWSLPGVFLGAGLALAQTTAETPAPPVGRPATAPLLLDDTREDEFVMLEQWPPRSPVEETKATLPQPQLQRPPQPQQPTPFRLTPFLPVDDTWALGPFRGNFVDNWGLLNTDAYHQLGMPIGAFVLYPALEVGGVFTDNVRQSKNNRKADVGLRLRPDFELQSDWQRHALTIHAESEHILYAKESHQDVDTANIQGRLRLDLRRDIVALIEGDYVLSQEGLAQADIPVNAVDPRKDEDYGVHARLSRLGGLFEASVRGGVSWHRAGNVPLSDGTVENNKDLNYTAPVAELRLQYQDPAIIKPFIEAAYLPRLYDHPDDVLGVKRSSDGLRLAIGTEFEDDEIWNGAVALTYERRDYYNLPAHRNVDGLGFNANIVWRPTRITAVAIDGASTIAETDVVEATAVREYVVGARVQHALRDNFIVGLDTRVNFSDYVGIKLNERTWTSGIDLAYFLTPTLAVIGGYKIIDYHATGGSRDYTENRIMAGFRLQR